MWMMPLCEIYKKRTQHVHGIPKNLHLLWTMGAAIVFDDIIAPSTSIVNAVQMLIQNYMIFCAAFACHFQMNNTKKICDVCLHCFPSDKKQRI